MGFCITWTKTKSLAENTHIFCLPKWLVKKCKFLLSTILLHFPKYKRIREIWFSSTVLFCNAHSIQSHRDSKWLKFLCQQSIQQYPRATGQTHLSKHLQGKNDPSLVTWPLTFCQPSGMGMLSLHCIFEEQFKFDLWGTSGRHSLDKSLLDWNYETLKYGLN